MGIPGGRPMRVISKTGLANGKRDSHLATEPLGSIMTSCRESWGFSSGVRPAEPTAAGS
jgi:hypothetical protein